MLLVLVMGATVTTTGSAQGCGRDWPLCNGRFIPEFAVSTAIEFSHRAVTGVEGILIAALAVAALALYGSQRPVQVLAPLMLGSLLLQAGMGAWAVKYPQQPVVLALHFGISLIALATATLTALYVRRPEEVRSAPPVSGGLRLGTWGVAGYLYLLIYSGAYIRHAAAAAACTSWPLCGSGRGDAAGVALNLAHRSAAGAALVLALGLLLAPITAAAADVAELYRARCAVCHGADGRGDGPAAAALRPPPADLRVHMAAGHTDAQLFNWVSNGVPGTAMPAWKDKLSEEDRWNAINYIRSFAPQAAQADPGGARPT
jgi:cytochrome c oxidase assembly protein subunit 15